MSGSPSIKLIPWVGAVYRVVYSRCGLLSLFVMGGGWMVGWGEQLKLRTTHLTCSAGQVKAWREMVAEHMKQRRTTRGHSDTVRKQRG
jgi:hypothetical protein